MRRPVILSTEESAYFAQCIEKGLGSRCERIDIERRPFPGGERYHRVMHDDRLHLAGRNVIYVASTHDDASINELYEVGCALATGCGSRMRIFAIPFEGYSTMERAVRPNEVVKAKTVARAFSSVPQTFLGNAFLFMDLHVSGFLHYFEGSAFRAELYGEGVIADAIAGLIKSEKLQNIAFASADLGRPKWVKAFATRFSCPIALIDKDRSFGETKVAAVIGSVRGATVIIYDDMIRGGGTIIQAAEAYLAKGAKSVYAATSHLALDNYGAIANLQRSPIAKIIATNSHPMSQHPAVQGSSKFVIRDVSGVFVPAIRRLLYL